MRYARSTTGRMRAAYSGMMSGSAYPQTIISGRGGPITIDTVREEREFLKSVATRMSTLAKRNAQPDETQNMIPALLEKISYPAEMEDFFSKRLEYGLAQYYKRKYVKTNSDDES